MRPTSFIGLDGPGSGWVAVTDKDGEPWIAAAPRSATGSAGGLDVTMSMRGRFAGPYVEIAPFEAGYVAYGTLDDSLESVATWYSSHGRAWRRTILSKPVVPCTGWSRRSDLESGSKPTAIGRAIVIVASVAAPTEADCGAQRLVALVSKDGRKWTRSEPFGATDVGYQYAGQAWPINGGVEVVTGSERSGQSIWRSTDGLSWSEVGSVPVTDEDSSFAILGSDSNGQLLASLSRDGARSELLASDDGSSWRTVRTLPEGYGVTDVVAPQQAGDPWWLAIQTWQPGGEVRLLQSTDLVTWERGRFPRGQMRSLTAGRSGWLAIGSDAASGDTCGPAERLYPALYTSIDGMTWREQRTRIREDRIPAFVDGPAGILGYEWLDGSIVVRHVEIAAGGGALHDPGLRSARSMRPMLIPGRASLIACGEGEPRG